MHIVLSPPRKNTRKNISTEVRLLWPSSQFGMRAEENRRSNLTAPMPLVAETKMGFWLNLGEQVFQSQKMFGAQESAAREPAELSLQKGCLISGVPAGLGCYLKCTERRCAGGHGVEEAGCRAIMQFCVTQLESGTFLHILINVFWADHSINFILSPRDPIQMVVFLATEIN